MLITEKFIEEILEEKEISKNDARKLLDLVDKIRQSIDHIPNRFISTGSHSRYYSELMEEVERLLKDKRLASGGYDYSDEVKNILKKLQAYIKYEDRDHKNAIERLEYTRLKKVYHKIFDIWDRIK